MPQIIIYFYQKNILIENIVCILCLHASIVDSNILHTHTEAYIHYILLLFSFISHTDLRILQQPVRVVQVEGEPGRAAVIQRIGFAFSKIFFTIRPLTYAEYENLTGQDLDALFPNRPNPAPGRITQFI